MRLGLRLPRSWRGILRAPAAAAKGLQKPGQRGQRGAQVLVDHGGEVDHGHRARTIERKAVERAIEVPAAFTWSARATSARVRPGDQIATGEGVMRLRQRVWDRRAAIIYQVWPSAVSCEVRSGLPPDLAASRLNASTTFCTVVSKRLGS